LKITTKKGDKGKTSLYGGNKISKDHIRVEAFGTLDELMSFLGLAKSRAKRKKLRKFIEMIQQDLVLIGSELATEKKDLKRLKCRINEDHIKRIEKIIADLEKKRGPGTNCFQISGSSFVSSLLDVSRTIARRLERRVVTLQRKKIEHSRSLAVYLNRLSDLLFLLAWSHK